ncbi:MAG: hypothetical protein WBW85_03775, partial [Terriglobales bacterium]
VSAGNARMQRTTRARRSFSLRSSSVRSSTPGFAGVVFAVDWDLWFDIPFDTRFEFDCRLTDQYSPALVLT